jgi:hypothetical protein
VVDRLGELIEFGCEPRIVFGGLAVCAVGVSEVVAVAADGGTDRRERADRCAAQ